MEIVSNERLKEFSIKLVIPKVFREVVYSHNVAKSKFTISRKYS